MKIKSTYGVIAFIGAVFLTVGIAFIAGGIIILVSTLRSKAYRAGLIDVKGGLDASMVLAIVFLFMGVLFAVLGGAFVGRYAAREKRIKRLITEGERLAGTIVKVTQVENVTINGAHPFMAECAVDDPFTGERRVYVSDGVTADISGYAGMPVTVYADREDAGSYYVDLSELTKWDE